MSTTTDPTEAVRGADVVFASIRVGGLGARRYDEHIPQRHGVLGQETVGAGGIAYAIRTIPPMVEYARLIAATAPNAWLINFTNPAGIVTEALQPILGNRVIGICDTPSGLMRRVMAILEQPSERPIPDYLGLNHLGWLRTLYCNGGDVLPSLLADDDRLPCLEEAQVFGIDWIRRLGAIPNEYLYYYLNTRHAIATIRATGSTRADTLFGSQSALFHKLSTSSPRSAMEVWRNAVATRNASYMNEVRGGISHPVDPRVSDEELLADGYATVAVATMRALTVGPPATLVLNTRNIHEVAGLPADAIIEVTCRVDQNGAVAEPVKPAGLFEAGLMQQIKAVERNAIIAATTGDFDAAVLAFGLHPLVDSLDIGHHIALDFRSQVPEFAMVFD